MSRMNSEKRLIIGYGLNAFTSIVLPLFALVSLHFYPYSSGLFLTNVFGVAILVTISASILLENHYLYVLNLFSGILFLNTFIKTSFPVSFIHIVFVTYAILTVCLFLLQFKKNSFLSNLFSNVRQ